MTFRRALVCALLALTLLPAAAANAAPSAGFTELKYIPVTDGTEIAVSVWYPEGFTDHPADWPALFEMDGYGGAKGPDDTQFTGKSKKFVVLYASVRGTGCSGGKFDLFSDQSAMDGYEIIENWLVKQAWSNGRVGVTGHSYSGLTGFMVAATHPPHVRGIALSGLIDDFYRGILYPGGVPNSGFPIAWGAGVRPLGEGQSNFQSQLSDDHCRTNFAQHQTTAYTPPPDVTVGAYTEMQATDESWSIQHSMLRHEPGIGAPIQIGQQFQDEQTGPRGGHILFDHVPAGLAKRLVMSNGRHNPNDPTRTKDAWLECWVINDGQGCGDVADPDKRVLVHFDSRTANSQTRNTPYRTSDWPAPETDWQRFFLRTDGKLDATNPGPVGAVAYAATATDQRTTFNEGLQGESTNAGAATQGGTPNEAVWTLPFTKNTALAGPIELTLWARLTSVDTDFFVDVIDRDTTTGMMYYLQRGLLRASFRELDEARSDRIKSGPHAGEIYRAYHPFVDPANVTPTQPVKYEIEVFPLAQVFRAGHELVLRIHVPPANDPLSTYAYPPEQAPGVVQILQDAGHPTSILLPFLKTLPAIAATPPTCGAVSGEVCFTPAVDGPTGPALP